MSACICVVSSLHAGRLCHHLAHLSLTQMEWLEPTVVMGLCFCEGTLARETGSGTEREHEACFVVVAF